MTPDSVALSGKTPRVLMIAPVFYPYPPVWPEGMVNAKLALAMQRAGWRVDIVIAGHPAAKNRYPAETSGWSELEDHVHVVELAPHKNVAQKVAQTAGAFRLTGRFLRHLAWPMAVKTVAHHLHAANGYDLILSRAVPDYAHFAGLLAHRQTRIPWIANWNDPTPNHKFPPPYGQGPSSPLQPAVRRWYQAIGRFAAWHTFPSERLRNYMCGYLPGAHHAKSTVIPHIAMDRFTSLTAPADGAFSMCYAGSVSPPRDATVLLEGVRQFAARRRPTSGSFNVRFMVDTPETVADIARRLGVAAYVKMEPSVPYTQMPEALARSHVLVIIEAPVEEGIFMPSKIVDYVQIGRPILAVAPAVGTMADIFHRHGGGMAVDCRSPETVAQAIETLHGAWQAGSLDRDYGSAKLSPLFSAQHVLDLYADLIGRLGRRNPAH